MKRIPAWLALVAVGVLVAAPALAAEGAAPAYVTSDPQDGATVDSPPSRVSVTFSEPLDSTSTLQVFDQCGRAVDAGDEQVLGSRIDVGIAQTPSGHYTAVYVAKGFAGATGETKGSFSFHVTSGESCAGDGGHDNHGGHGDGDGGGGHDGHGDGGHGDDDQGGHGGGSAHDDGHDGPSGTHDDHGGTGHGDGGHGDDGHGGDDHGDGHGAGGPHGKGGNGAHGNDAADDDSTTDLAAGRDGPGLAPTSTSVLIALSLSIGMGALGGWVLRVSAGS